MSGRHALGPRHQWRLTWDGKVHAFASFGEVSSVAACTHIASTLKQPVDGSPRCSVCLTALGYPPTAVPPADPPAATPLTPTARQAAGDGPRHHDHDTNGDTKPHEPPDPARRTRLA